MCGDEISHGRGLGRNGRNTKRDIIEVGKPKLVPSAQERLKPEMMRVRFCWEHSNFGSKGADCSFLRRRTGDGLCHLVLIYCVDAVMCFPGN